MHRKREKAYVCTVCEYSTPLRNNFTKHITTKKHIYATNPSVNHVMPCHRCSICNQRVETMNGLRRHIKTRHPESLHKTTQNDDIHAQNSQMSVPPVVIEMIGVVKDIVINQQQQILELTKKSLDICGNQNIQHSNLQNSIGTQNNINNNSFNVNVFLGSCENAMDIMEFANNAELDLDDLEQTAKHGYVEGISRIFIGKMKKLGLLRRPVHCTDVKRGTLYVKNDGEWSKDEATNNKLLTKAIKILGRKNISQISKWMEENPDYNDIDSKTNDEYLKLVSNTMICGTAEEEQENINKIIKNVAKEVAVDKTPNV